MLAKTRGIILHQVKYSDSSMIVSIYTREFGRTAYAVRGANNKKSTCRAALLQPLSIVEIDVRHNAKKEIQTIKDIRVAVPFFQLPYNPVKSSLALFVAEVLHKTVKHSEQDEALYAFIEESVCHLDTLNEGIGNFHLVFMAGLAARLGFAPYAENEKGDRYFDMMNGVFNAQRPEHIHFLEGRKAEVFKHIMELNYDHLDTLVMNREYRADLLNNFLTYYELHIPGFQSIKSVDVLHKIWE